MTKKSAPPTPPPQKNQPLKGAEIDVISPNLKRRLSGVSATIIRLTPLLAHQIGIVVTGPLRTKAPLPRLSLWRALTLKRDKWRVWHARRNTEMLLGLFARAILRRRFRLLFTSASQRVHTRYTKWLISRMDRVIATSQKTALYLDRPADVILHGIDSDKFAPPEDRNALRQRLNLAADNFIIGCFGRIRAQKGTDLFVDAMSALAQKHSDITGLVMGRATRKHRAYFEELKKRVKEAGLEKNILFLPETPADEMAQWYQALDLYVAPQRWEGFGLTPLEAMACAVPVIASKVGAFEELVVEGKTGALIAPNSAEAIENACRKLYLDKGDHQIQSQNARAHICAAFSLEKEADALCKIYRALLDASS